MFSKLVQLEHTGHRDRRTLRKPPFVVCMACFSCCPKVGRPKAVLMNEGCHTVCFARSGVTTNCWQDLAACAGGFRRDLGLYDVVDAGPNCYPLAFANTLIFKLPSPGSNCYYDSLAVLGTARLLQNSIAPLLVASLTRFGVVPLPENHASELLDLVLRTQCEGTQLVTKVCLDDLSGLLNLHCGETSRLGPRLRMRCCELLAHIPRWAGGGG